MGDFVADNPLVLLIGACEIAFWVLLGLGLAARYLLRLRRTSAVLLLLVPVLDLVLVGASLLDVAGGSPPGTTHGLAAVYLGFTVAFGHSVIRWVDARFAHRFAGGPPPPRPPEYGAARAVHEWREFGKATVAWAVAVGIMAVTATVAGQPIPPPLEWDGEPLWAWGWRITVAAAIWLVVGPLWATVFPKRERSDARG